MPDTYIVVMPDGKRTATLTGTAEEIVTQMRQADWTLGEIEGNGGADAAYRQAVAHRVKMLNGREIPTGDPLAFLMGLAAGGVITLTESDTTETDKETQ